MSQGLSSVLFSQSTTSSEIAPGLTDNVVILQPFQTEPPNDFQPKDKFMVQSVTLNEELDGLTLALVVRHLKRTQSTIRGSL